MMCEKVYQSEMCCEFPEESTVPISNRACDFPAWQFLNFRPLPQGHASSDAALIEESIQQAVLEARIDSTNNPLEMS